MLDRSILYITGGSVLIIMARLLYGASENERPKEPRKITYSPSQGNTSSTLLDPVHTYRDKFKKVSIFTLFGLPSTPKHFSTWAKEFTHPLFASVVFMPSGRNSLACFTPNKMNKDLKGIHSINSQNKTIHSLGIQG